MLLLGTKMFTKQYPHPLHPTTFSYTNFCAKVISLSLKAYKFCYIIFILKVIKKISAMHYLFQQILLYLIMLLLLQFYLFLLQGLKCLLENPLTVRCLVGVLPKLTGLFHDISENVRIAFCQLLLRVKKISAIKVSGFIKS